MKTFALLLLLTVPLLAAPTPSPSPTPAASASATPAAKATPAPQENSAPARSRALELAGAFANEGYKIRDGYWAGTLEKGKPLVLEINLFAGNEYWVSAAATQTARKISLVIYDAKGREMAGEAYQDGPVAAAGCVPVFSGPYFVRLELTDGDKADFCLVYSYK